MRKFFKHPLDTKNLLIGVIASIFGVIIWDIVKERKLWNGKSVEKEVEEFN